MKQEPVVKFGNRTLTAEEAEAALEHAAAFITLVESQEPARFGQAAEDWLKRYGEQENAATGSLHD